MKKILGCSLLLLSAGVAFAQKPVARADSFPLAKPRALYLIGQSYGDSVVLRWAPREPIFWKAANQGGYLIRRYVVEGKQPPKNPVGTTLTKSPVKPWPLEEWKTRAQREDTLAAAAAQVLHGKSVTLPDPTKGATIGEAMNAKTDLDNRHAFALFLADQSAFIATGMGLRWVDRSFEKGKTYVYTVHALTDPQRYRSDTAAVLINTAESVREPGLPAVTVEPMDRAVKFSWDRRLAGMFFTAYYYERSEDNGKTFRRLNAHPFVQPVSPDQLDSNPPIVLIDSLPRNYQPYVYRIYGLTPFGGLGKPTKNLPVTGRDQTPPSPPVNVLAENTKSNDVRIRWQKTLPEADFAGYLVGRSQNVSGPFLPLNLKPLAKNVLEFIDTGAVASGTNYYVVGAVDTAGNAGLSIPAYVVMKDTIPPRQPTGLSGLIDTTGIVRLRWTLGKEPDLYGYLVYYANAADHQFTPVTQDFLVDSTFTDSISLRTLTEKIYYRIVAFDKNRNPSPYSEVLELKKPDKVPPVPAVFTDFRVTDTTVTMNWAPSSSTDLASQILYRREKEGDWVEYGKLNKTQNAFVDKTVKKQTWYEYSLVAVDDAGLVSEQSFPLHVRVYDSGVRKKIEAFSAVESPDGKAIVLSWRYPVKECRLVIYRAFNDGGLLTYQSIPSEEVSFVDTRIRKGNYAYAIKAIYEDGGESPLTKPVQVNFGK
ncbi:MAG: hypothetical protein H7Z75_02645 [Ferruginibacter sp.]|nr:hypothetical protein [Cytophagales bacterium]